ncbi:hypothetical protein [Streptomyces sp. NPDC004267]|uniref:hypothetical protein n=1 Tax=Streptomyces sp. NPDC004267 TaxID=3364694 RepID=UPI0036D1B9C1
MTHAPLLTPVDVWFAPAGTCPTDRADWQALGHVSDAPIDHDADLGVAGDWSLSGTVTVDLPVISYTSPRPLLTTCEGTLGRILKHAQRSRVASLLAGAMPAPQWPCRPLLPGVPASS